MGSKSSREVWVGPNRRALGLGLIPPLALLSVGTGLCLVSQRGWPMIVGFAMGAVAAVAIALLVREWFRPRIAYRPECVEFYLRAGKPLAVPLEHVEAFFLGHGEAVIPGKHQTKLETITLVARLSRRAEEWSHMEVLPALGRWCDGYVTIQGMWCEPLTEALVERLNRRLYEVTHEQRAEVAR